MVAAAEDCDPNERARSRLQQFKCVFSLRFCRTYYNNIYIYVCLPTTRDFKRVFRRRITMRSEDGHFFVCDGPSHRPAAGKRIHERNTQIIKIVLIRFIIGTRRFLVLFRLEKAVVPIIRNLKKKKNV